LILKNHLSSVEMSEPLIFGFKEEPNDEKLPTIRMLFAVAHRGHPLENANDFATRLAKYSMRVWHVDLQQRSDAQAEHEKDEEKDEETLQSCCAVFSSADDAKRAMADLNDSVDEHGRRWTASYASQTRELWVGMNLSQNASHSSSRVADQVLRNAFDVHGHIEALSVHACGALRDKFHALVRFASADEASRALAALQGATGDESCVDKLGRRVQFAIDFHQPSAWPYIIAARAEAATTASARGGVEGFAPGSRGGRGRYHRGYHRGGGGGGGSRGSYRGYRGGGGYRGSYRGYRGRFHRDGGYGAPRQPYLPYGRGTPYGRAPQPIRHHRRHHHPYDAPPPPPPAYAPPSSPPRYNEKHGYADPYSPPRGSGGGGVYDDAGSVPAQRKHEQPTYVLPPQTYDDDGYGGPASSESQHYDPTTPQYHQHPEAAAQTRPNAYY
jgi:hypothetical protein